MFYCFLVRTRTWRKSRTYNLRDAGSWYVVVEAGNRIASIDNKKRASSITLSV
jgi:hypothetical protein